MELAEWCGTLRKSINDLSMETRKTVPYMINELLTQCEKAASGEPDDESSVKIALVGTFSSGKSSFLNAVFDRDLTAVDIEQTTRCRTDFTYGPEFKIINIRNGEELSPEEYQRISRIGHATEDSHYLALLPDPRLEGILFMDTPGFDPPKDGKLDKEQQDAAISERAAEDADIVFFLIEAKDGTIREDCLEYMRKLNERTQSSDHPLRLAVILNKADLKMPSARQQIVDDVKIICQKNKINVERFILHTSRKPKKDLDFYLQCQSDIWDLVKKYQQEKKLILGARHGVWAQLSRQSLVDLRDILDKFTDFRLKQLEKKEERFTKKSEESVSLKIEAIAEQLKAVILDFTHDNRWNYSSNYMIDSSGIFGWDWTKDWKAFITNDKNNVIPTGDVRSGLLQKIKDMLNEYLIPSPEVYANRLLGDMDTLMISVFTEDDGTQHYKRCGRSRVCSVESDADKQSAEWQNEFYYELEAQASAFFTKHVDNALSSLLALEDNPKKLDIAKDRKILSKITRLLSSEFPALHEKSGYLHPVLEMSTSVQRKYIALVNIIRKTMPESASQKLLEEIRQIDRLGNLGFSEDCLIANDKKGMDHIFSEQSDLQDNQKDLLVTWALTDAGFAAGKLIDVEKILNAIKTIAYFKDIEINSPRGIFAFGTYAATAKDEADLAEKACADSDGIYPLTWAHLMINRGFDVITYRCLEAAVRRFSWKEINNMLKTNNFTTKEDGGLLLEDCIWPFDRDAADFLIAHGCDVNAVSGDGNVVRNLNMFLSEEAFTYLLDHDIQITKETWGEMFMMNKDTLIAIATKRDPGSVPPESVFEGFMMSLETLKAYGDNGGNLDIYSEENDCSLVDFFVRNDQNDLVEYMRSHGIQPSADAKSTSQMLDELSQLFK